jgi:N-acetyltransferase
MELQQVNLFDPLISSRKQRNVVGFPGCWLDPANRLSALAIASYAHEAVEQYGTMFAAANECATLEPGLAGQDVMANSDIAGFRKPSHQHIAGTEKARGRWIVWHLVQRSFERGNRLVELSFIEMTDADAGPVKRQSRRARIKPKRLVDMLEREIKLACKSPDHATPEPTQCRARNARENVVDHPFRHVDVFEIHQGAGSEANCLRIVGCRRDRAPRQFDASRQGRSSDRDRSPDQRDRAPALETIGFKVTGLAARVLWVSPPDSPLGPKTHMLLKVDLPDGPRLADVGFGVCVMDTPLTFQTDIEQRTAMGTYRLSEADGLFCLSAIQPAGWRRIYAFNLEPQIHSDYEIGSRFAATHPAAPFSSTLIMERLSDDKRYKLVN